MTMVRSSYARELSFSVSTSADLFPTVLKLALNHWEANAMRTTLHQLRSALCSLGVLFQSYIKYYRNTQKA
jgi:hypothetical protein